MGKIIRASDRATKTQPNTNFTGTVYADEVVVGEKPSRMRATRVSFTPRALIFCGGQGIRLMRERPTAVRLISARTGPNGFS